MWLVATGPLGLCGRTTQSVEQTKGSSCTTTLPKTLRPSGWRRAIVEITPPRPFSPATASVSIAPGRSVPRAQWSTRASSTHCTTTSNMACGVDVASANAAASSSVVDSRCHPADQAQLPAAPCRRSNCQIQRCQIRRYQIRRCRRTLAPWPPSQPCRFLPSA